jgi:BlaR1 peptidase M56
MVYFLFKSAVCLAIFYGFYFLLLRKETFFHWNRCFLLVTAALSLFIPLLNIQINKEEKAQLPQLIERVQIAPHNIEYQLVTPIAPAFSMSLGEVFGGLYIGVALVLALLFLMKITRLWWLLKTSKKEQKEGFSILETSNKNVPTASFFGYIFWKNNPNDSTQQLILQHELAHVRGFHSVDVLLSEILIIFQWFNPMAWSLRRSLHSIHEYIADDWVVRNTCRRYDYALLLTQSAEIASPRLTNGFHSQLKNRLVMLSKSPSRPLLKVKYLLSLPLAAALMLLFSFRLVEKIELPRPLQNAVNDATLLVEKITETPVFQEVTDVLLPEKVEENAIGMVAEKTPYIFYWGAIEAKIQYLKGTDEYFAEVNIKNLDLLQTYNRVPRMYNGKTLEKTASFIFVTPHGEQIPVKSTLEDKELESSIRTKLNVLYPKMADGSQYQLTNLQLPNGKTANIRLLIQNKDLTSDDLGMPKQRATNKFEHSWGKYLGFNDAKRPYLSFSQLWETIQESPKFQINGVEWDTMKASMAIVTDGFDPVEVIFDNTQPLDNQSRYEKRGLAFFQSYVNQIKVGTIIYLDIENYPNIKKGESRMGMVFKIVEEDSPLLQMSKERDKLIGFQLGKFIKGWYLYGKVILDKNGNEIPTKRSEKMEMYDFSINELSLMLELKPQLWRETYIGTPKYTLKYRNFQEEYNPSTGFSPDFIKNVRAALNKSEPLEITNIKTEEWDISPMTLVFWPQ